MCTDNAITATVFLQSGSLKYISTLNNWLFFLGWIWRYLIAFFNNSMGFSMLLKNIFMYFAGNSNVNYIPLKVPANVNSHILILIF